MAVSAVLAVSLFFPLTKASNMAPEKASPATLRHMIPIIISA
jgi:hypothetical protein